MSTPVTGLCNEKEFFCRESTSTYRIECDQTLNTPKYTVPVRSAKNKIPIPVRVPADIDRDVIRARVYEKLRILQFLLIFWLNLSRNVTPRTHSDKFIIVGRTRLFDNERGGGRVVGIFIGERSSSRRFATVGKRVRRQGARIAD